jgi:Skp family chaperone for outer membrane proteins
MNEDTNSNTTSTEPSDIKSRVLAFRDNAHAENVKKLKAGIKCIFTVPACFLILLFLTGSSKIIFLVLWIASLFIIAAYLIHVEYSDYKVQEMVNSLQDTEDNIDGLIDINSIYTKVAAPKKKLDDIITNVKTDIQTQITAVQDKVAEMAEAVQMDEQNNTGQPDELVDSVQPVEQDDTVSSTEQNAATENTEADKEELS